jgi:cytochrome c oxidase subunit 2
MFGKKSPSPWKVLIASSHPLFAEGLRSLLHKRQETEVEVVGLVSTINEALLALNSLQPDLIIVDYDDEHLNRDEFLAHFVEGRGQLRVVLLSLGERGEEAIVYDRRTMAAAQIDDWLEKWIETENSITPPNEVFSNVGKENGNSMRRNNIRHYIAAGLLVIFLTVAGFFGLSRVNLLPVEASVQAESIDGLFAFHFRAIAFLFALIVGIMLYSIIVFRRKPGDTTDGPHVTGNTPLEVMWTVLPLATVLFVSYMGANVLGETLRADPHPLVIKVIGSQWSWRFEYPDLQISSTELIMPVNKQALLRTTSLDVIHSFWVPEFRIKQDALPGGDEMIREVRITPKQIGEYKVRCAELCGRGHADMRANVKVLSSTDYDAWVASQTAALSNDPVVRGDKWSQQYGCRACHSTDGSAGVGPTWKGVFGHEVTLSDGSKVLADHDYLFESIRDPGAKIVEGFQNVMPPNIAADMTDQQVEDVIAFIESLK